MLSSQLHPQLHPFIPTFGAIGTGFGKRDTKARPVLAPVGSFIRRDPGAGEAFHRAHSYIGPIPSSAARYPLLAPGARLEEPFWAVADRDSAPFFGEAVEEGDPATELTFQAVPLLGSQPDCIGREGRLSVLRRLIYAPTAWVEEARRIFGLGQRHN